MPAIITADSTPDYDNLGIDSYWSCNEWIDWHKALKTKYGQKIANTTWQTAWDKQDVFEHDYNWCKYDGVFNAYVRKEGLNASNFLANVLNSITSTAENAGDTAVNATKILKYLIPIVVIGSAIALFIYAAKRLQ